jgi:hypothetical protein
VLIEDAADIRGGRERSIVDDDDDTGEVRADISDVESDGESDADRVIANMLYGMRCWCLFYCQVLGRKDELVKRKHVQERSPSEARRPARKFLRSCRSRGPRFRDAAPARAGVVCAVLHRMHHTSRRTTPQSSTGGIAATNDRLAAGMVRLWHDNS